MTDEESGRTRRAYLRAALAGGLSAGVAGCSFLGSGGDTPTAADTATSDRSTATDATASAAADTATASTDTAETEASGTDTATATAEPTATPTPNPLADASGSYRAYRYDARRRAFAPDASGPDDATVAYTLELPGSVHQPLVDGTTVLLPYRSRTPALGAVSLRDGADQWAARTAGQPGSPPVVDGGSVYVQTDAGLSAVSAGGDTDWRRSVGEGSFAPTLAGDRLFAVGGRTIVALDRSGAEQWRVPLGRGPLGPAAAAGPRVFVTVDRGTGERGALALDARSGRTDWRATVDARRGAPPVVDGDRVYVTGEFEGLTALSVDSGSREWSRDVPATTVPAVTDDVVAYADSDRRDIAALAVDDGEREWATTLYAGESVAAGPVADPDTVYVGLDTHDGGAVRALAADDGSERWTVETEALVSTPPVVVDGAVLVVSGTGDDTRLRALAGG